MKNRYYILFLTVISFLLCIVFEIDNVFANTDKRIPVSNVTAISNINEILVVGNKYDDPTFEINSGTSALVVSGMPYGRWEKKIDGEWQIVFDDYFTPGSWRYMTRVMFSSENDSLYKLQEPFTLKVDNLTWESDVTDYGYTSFSWVYSPEYILNEPENAELTFNKNYIFDIDTSYVGIAIESRNISSYVYGGEKPYKFSKRNGPDWIKVSSDGIISGTPNKTSSSSSVTIRVTDNKGDYKEVKYSVGEVKPNPNAKTQISSVSATSEDIDSIPKYGADVTNKPTVSVVTGAPAYFLIDDGNGHWQKYIDGRWTNVTSGTFTEGTWRFKCQVRIDGESGKNYELADQISVKLNNKSITAEESYIDESYSYAWILSPEVTIEKPSYSKYDYNKDGEVDLLDVKQLFRIYMVTADRENKEFVSKHDINNDGIVDLLDVKQFFRLYMTGYFD